MPVAVGRTAVAVGGLADSGIVFGLTRTRLWIGVLAGLLVGIVALNVATLQLNSRASKHGALAEELQRENSAIRAQIADNLSNERLQSAAARLGLVAPQPSAVRYLTPRPGDAAAAAQRLRNGEITVGDAYTAPVVTEAVAVEAEPLTGEVPVDVAPVAPVPAPEAGIAP